MARGTSIEARRILDIYLLLAFSSLTAFSVLFKYRFLHFTFLIYAYPSIFWMSFAKASYHVTCVILCWSCVASFSF